MKRSRQEVAETRSQIVKRAAAEFRRNGVDSGGIAPIMSALGLTHGGFYRHFESKEALVAESIGDAIIEVLAETEKRCGKPGLDGLRQIARQYLSGSHRDNLERGCPLAALGTDLRRADSRTRHLASDGIGRMISIVEGKIRALSPIDARTQAMGVVSAMVGGMILSRLADNRKFSTEILKATREFIAGSARKKTRRGK